MDETEMVNKLYSYAFYGAAAALALLGALSGSYLVAIPAAFLLLCSAVYFSSGRIINNLLFRGSRIIAYHNEYRLDPGLIALTRREGRYYKGLAVALVRPEGAMEVRTETLRNLIEGMHESFEFSVVVAQADKKRMVEALDTRRRMKEIQLAKLAPGKQDRANALTREIRIIEAEMAGIQNSGRAFDTCMKIGASALADSEAAAARQAAHSLERICDAFTATTKLGCEILRGESLLEFMRLSG